MPEQIVLHAATNAFGLDLNRLTYVGGNVNDLYEYPPENGYPARILRLSNQKWHTAQESLAELYFMKYLGDNGVPVPEVYSSRAGQLVENATEGHHASLFSKAPGRTPTEEDWRPDMFRNWGRVVGQMHALTQTYEPLQALRRRDWKQEAWMDMLRHLPFEEPIARQKATDILNWLDTLPKDSKNYGLVHCDLHAHNFFVTADGAITAFDFDDSCYHWFAYDIALIIYSVITRYNRQDVKNDTLDGHVDWFLNSFLKGYLEVHNLEDWWLKAMPDFLRYRRLLIYNFFHRRNDWRTLEGEQKVKWLRMKAEIEADEPLTNYAF